MCYICNCFTWTLDLLQRILTFFLSCWLVCCVCCGLGIATIAGVAYGYNYCFAEFIVHKRPDVKVYMRRGQFYAEPDMLSHHRSSGDDDDAFVTSLTEEYQQEDPPGDDFLTKRWEKDRDTRKYAVKLTKYSDSKNNIVNAKQSYIYHQQEDDSGLLQWEKSQGTPRYSSEKAFFNADYQVPEGNIYYKLAMPPARRISILPNLIIPTTVIRSGSSEIVMRKFEPLPNIVPEPSEKVEDYGDQSIRIIGKETDSNTKPPEEIERRTQASSSDTRTRLEDSPTRKLVKIRHWGASSKPVMLEYATDVDEDNVIYKAA